MSNAGKFIDRNPNLRPAGIVKDFGNESAEDVLKLYHEEEVAEAIVKRKCKASEAAARSLYPRSQFIPTDVMKDIFSTELKKSRFVEFREKFSEELFFKKPELGKAAELHVKPDYITNENTTFGTKSEVSEPAYQLALPNKKQQEINHEYMKFHDKYVLSHNHYFPSERICRKYDQANFNPASTFGIESHADITGGGVRRCMTRCEKMFVIKKKQMDFLNMSMGGVGKVIRRPGSIIHKDMVFGAPTPPNVCDAKALIELIDPCVRHTKLIDSIAHINKLRRSLMSRINFQINDFMVALREFDTENLGYLPLEKVVETAYALKIRMDLEKIRTAAKHYDLLVGKDFECIDYKRFLQILQIQYPLPKTGNISTTPDNVYNKDTTYRELCKDMYKAADEAKEPRIRKPPRNEVTAEDLVCPDTPLRLGLVKSDFEATRPKEELRRIFKRLVPDLEMFENIWQQTRTQLNRENDLISVNELRSVIDNANIR